MIGQMVSHYRILEEVGRGGMGVVYRAHDTRLERDVALKFLPAHLSASEQDKARFIQEAKAAATLDHPNICTIHSIEEHDHQLFIVMQFVDGQLLRDRMSTLSLKQAMEIGIQVAEGLAAAHDKGVVHRDIKPENIMVRKDGIAQIMDFGLAKLKGISRLTQEGSTVGTAGYMSPEQIQGQDADHRSDIFSLGVLLYEMMTGQLPFKGVHETAMAYEIVNVDATPMAVVKPEIDPELDRIVLECLEKDPGERFQSTAEIAKELRRYKRESSRQRTTRTIAARQFEKPPTGGPSQASPPVSSTWKRFLWPAISAILAVAFAAALFTRPDGQANDVPVMMFPVNLPLRSPLVLGAASLAIAPDGKHIAYLAADQSTGNAGGTNISAQLYLRPLADLTAKPMAGSEGASDPFFSADGQWVGFFVSGKLKKVSIFGGAAQEICTVDGFMRGACWDENDMIWFGHLNSTILRVPASGGTPEPVTIIDTVRGEISHRFPQILPGNKWVLFTVKQNNITSFDEAVIVAENVETHERRELVRGGSYGRFVSAGYVMYARGTSLYAVPFDVDRVEVTGPPIPVLQGGMLNPLSGTANVEVSQNGILIYTPIGPVSGLNNILAWMDRSGKLTPIASEPKPYDDARLAPDNTSIALTLRAANDDIWVSDITRGTLTRLTFGGGNSGLPEWTPDGKKVIFPSERGKETRLFWKTADGSGSIEQFGVAASVGVNFRPTMTPDGQRVIYGSRGDLWEMPVGADQGAKPILETPSFEDAPRLSSDGKLLAFLSDESGRNEVYVIPYPRLSGKWQISTDGAGSAPVWNPRGNELFYAQQGALMKVNVSGAPNVVFSRPEKICDLPPAIFGFHDIARDGSRFLITVSAEENSIRLTQLNVVVGWFTELRQKFAALQ
jgi:serine/threonine-protein kinase